MRNPRDIIKRPVISERSMGLLEENKYTFYVDPKANKLEIKHAIQELFNVTVVNVNTMNVKGKTKRVGRFVGKTPNRKKAIVTLKEGDKIEVFEGV
ncbi:50S ribosomal protein L25 [Thermincola ferriacetica]|uniref:Large ribosomal subunit protein uL23 n=2 Tax=Thermincola TaxID=278993 RepID=D5XA85_THEPJ|nr:MULTISPECIES: 50S ribosomal protein L23 [Thermincola]ADG81184.1 Ribosomal protein L25/L23 [Thermincola potens JR]KNZ69478.1 50S ribosomal protein L25 [Thermincola ferriacetica]